MHFCDIFINIGQCFHLVTKKSEGNQKSGNVRIKYNDTLRSKIKLVVEKLFKFNKQLYFSVVFPRSHP